jgi:hypothetical protein
MAILRMENTSLSEARTISQVVIPENLARRNDKQDLSGISQ